MGLFGSGKNKEEKQKNKVIQKAQKYAQKGQIENAVAEWASLLKNKAEDANIYNTIGDLYLKGNLKDKAIESYRKACKSYTDSGFALKAIAVNKKVLKIDPNDLDSMMSMAHLHKERGMVANAKECYLAIAEYHIRTGSHDKALEAYQKIVDMDPKNLKVKVSLAELYLKEEMAQEGSKIYGEVIGALLEESRYDEAEKLCKKLEGSLGSPGANLKYMVQIHLAQNRVDEASVCAKQLEERGEQDSETAVYNAEILIRKGHAKEGIDALRKIDRSAVTEFVLLKIFRHLLAAGETDQALDVLNEIAEKYLASNRFEELCRLYQQVIDHDPDHLKVRQQMVDLLKKMKRDQDLIQQYKEMGRIYASSGHQEEARNIYEKVMCMIPEDIETKALLKGMNRDVSPGGAIEFDGTVISPASEGGAETAEEENVYAIDDKMEIETFAAGINEPEVLGTEAPAEAPASSGDAGDEIEVIKESGEDQETFLTDNISEADVYMKYGHMKKAIVHLEKNLESAPKHIPTHERLLQIFIEQGNIQEQINTLMILAKLYLAQGEHKKSEEALNEILVLDPGNEDAVRSLKEGPMALSSNATDEAEAPREAESFEFEFDDKGKAGAGPGQEEADAPKEKAGDAEPIDDLLDEADFYLQNGMIDEARAVYEKILNLHPDRTDVAGKLKEISGNGDKESPAPDEMSKMFSEVALEFGGKTPVPTGSAEDDLTSIKTGIPGEEAPSPMVDDFNSFAEALRQEVDGTLSGEDHGTGASSGDADDMLDFSSELRREVEDSLASTGEVFGDHDVMDIFNEFREGVQRELGDEDHETHYNLGIAYMEMGLIDEACEEFSIASRDSGRLMDCLTMIGLCYTQKGEFHKALAELERGLTVQGRSDEEYNSIRYEIAKVSELLGNKERAVKELLDIHENNPGYRDLQAKLKAFGVKTDDRPLVKKKFRDKKNKVSYL